MDETQANHPQDTSQKDWMSLAQRVDQHTRASLGQWSLGQSPMQNAVVWLDWISHLATAPGKQLSLVKTLADDIHGAAIHLTRVDGKPRECCTDPRFLSPTWQTLPFNAFAQAFQITERFWSQATTAVPGLNHRHEERARFAARQWLDVFSPSNVPWLNPDVLAATKTELGMNFARGFQYWLDDAYRLISKQPAQGSEEFKVGENVAITRGKVVFKNDLIELIQYSPSTPKVYGEPVLIVPAWIMKYYILDLSPHNSLVKFLVDRGHTVFMISWKNPSADDCEKGLEAYRTEGVMAAINTVSKILPDHRIHGVGYCLGGTMLEIAAATMGRDKDSRLATMTLFAAQGDFTEAGELLLFINESEVNIIEAMMAEQGYLKGTQMAGTFQLLHSNDLIWSRALKNYMLGVRDQPSDLMAWNADTTRMPYRMHSEYLHKLFLHNELASGHYEVNGAPIWFTDIKIPCFAVGTETDHVAPWKSVFKLHLLPLDITFVLTSGGHNAGIVSEPGHQHRHFQVHHRTADEPYTAPEQWHASVPRQEGSWWPAWESWLSSHSGERLITPPRMGVPGHKGKLVDAPGEYVHQS